MKRRERSRALIDGDRGLAQKLADQVRRDHQVVVLQEPRDGLVMVRMGESARRSQFYLGEVLVYEAKVRVEGSLGRGLVQVRPGIDPSLAMDLAVVDAAFEAGCTVCSSWDEELNRARHLAQQKAEIAWARSAETRVDFLSMGEEDYVK